MLSDLQHTKKDLIRKTVYTGVTNLTRNAFNQARAVLCQIHGQGWIYSKFSVICSWKVHRHTVEIN